MVQLQSGGGPSAAGSVDRPLGAPPDVDASVWRRPFGRRVAPAMPRTPAPSRASVWRRPFGRRVVGAVLIDEAHAFKLQSGGGPSAAGSSHPAVPVAAPCRLQSGGGPSAAGSRQRATRQPRTPGFSLAAALRPLGLVGIRESCGTAVRFSLAAALRPPGRRRWKPVRSDPPPCFSLAAALRPPGQPLPRTLRARLPLLQSGGGPSAAGSRSRPSTSPLLKSLQSGGGPSAAGSPSSGSGRGSRRGFSLAAAPSAAGSRHVRRPVRHGHRASVWRRPFGRRVDEHPVHRVAQYVRASVWRRPFGRRVVRPSHRHVARQAASVWRRPLRPPGHPRGRSTRSFHSCFSLAAALRPPGRGRRARAHPPLASFSLAAALRPPGPRSSSPTTSGPTRFSLAAALRPPGRPVPCHCFSPASAVLQSGGGPSAAGSGPASRITSRTPRFSLAAAPSAAGSRRARDHGDHRGASVWRRPFGRRVVAWPARRGGISSRFSLAAALRPPGPNPGTSRRESSPRFSLAAALRPPGQSKAASLTSSLSVWRRPFGRRVSNRAQPMHDWDGLQSGGGPSAAGSRNARGDAREMLPASVWRRPFGRRVPRSLRRQQPPRNRFSLAAALRPPGRGLSMLLDS